jgi:hypothetical protein
MLKELFSPQNYYWNYYATPQISCCVFYLLLGTFVYLKNRGSRLNLLFFLVCLSTFFWFLGVTMCALSLNKTVAGFWIYPLYTGIVLLPIFFYHFAMVLIEREREERFTLILIYIMDIAFIAALVFTDTFMVARKRFFGWYGEGRA